MSNLSHGNESFLRVYCLANQTHFGMKGGAAGLNLNLEVTAIQKWPIANGKHIFHYEISAGNFELPFKAFRLFRKLSCASVSKRV